MIRLFLSDRYQEAMNFAFKHHRNQLRKGSGVPYMTHLMSVSALVMEHGGGEDEGIAALLHDAIEDQNVTYDEIRIRFGDRVADIVQGCTKEDLGDRSLKEAREDYFKHLRQAFPPVLLVSACDKLHNLRHTLQDLEAGHDIWKRFKGGLEGTLWYYKNLSEVFRVVGIPQALSTEIVETYRRLEAHVLPDPVHKESDEIPF